MWYIWKPRNRKIFEHFSEHPHDTLGLATQEETAWKRANTKEDTSNGTHSQVTEDAIPQDTPIYYTNESRHAGK